MSDTKVMSVDSPVTPTQAETTTTTKDQTTESTSSPEPILTKDFGFIPIPTWLRYNPEKPFHFGLLLNGAFGFASTFTVANLYYCQPLLIQLAAGFGVSYNRVSIVPTLVQTGYAVGLLLITPLGDLVRRRQLILLLNTLAATLTIGIALSNNIVAFQVLSFLVGIVTVTPQILIPFAADLAPASRRATAIAIVLSGLLLGVLIARVLAGIIAEFSNWRAVYYFAIGVQYFIVGGLYLMLPDYPAKNKGTTYFQILWTMAKFAVTEPLLIQACLINMGSAACFTNFWVTLTFLLGGPPYHYSTLVIGLFGLVGMTGVILGPFAGRGIDKLVPWYATLAGLIGQMVFQAVQVGAGGINVAAVIIACLGLDIFRQTSQVSLTSAVFNISVEARSRLNAVLILSLFIGQVMGTSVGTKVFLEHGWRAGASLSMALYGFQFAVLMLRGPHMPLKSWFGFKGGFRPILAKHLHREDSTEGTITPTPADMEKKA